MTNNTKSEKEEKDPRVSTIEKYINNYPRYGFFLKTIKEMGVPYPMLEFKCMRDGRPSSADYMSPDKENIRFFTPTIDGDMEIYHTDTKNVKIHDWYLTRWQKPIDTKDGAAKYTPVRGGGTRLLMTPAVVDSYREKKKVEVLYLIEGFKKALSFWAHSGLPIMGMNGLSGFKEPQKERLRPELRDYLRTCDVDKVVLIYDSDLFEIGKSKDKPETTKPNNFYRACLSARHFMEPFCDVVMVHPKPHPDKKFGFDDLLFEHRENELKNDDLKRFEVKPDPGHDRVFKAFHKAVKMGHSDLFQSLRLTAVHDFKVKQYFNLDDVMAFYEAHKEKLKTRGKFKFYTRTYRFKDDGTLEELKDDNTFGFVPKDNRIMKRDKDGNLQEVANFIIQILYHIQGEESVRIAELTNYQGKKAIIEIVPEDFTSPQRFTALCISQGEFIYKGGKDDLLNLATLLFKHEKPARAFHYLGYQPRHKIFSFANGIVTPDDWRECDEHGIVEYNDTYFYFPAYSKFNLHKDEMFSEERKYSHIKPEKEYSFNQWKKQFSAVYGPNAEIAAAFYVASLFSDIIFAHSSGIGYPLLWSSGKPKTGKSTICQSILKMFGDGITSESLTGSSTIKYKAARFSQFRNGIVHLDEYKSNDPKTQDFLKNIFDRLGYGTKTFSNDAKTRMNHILATAMVSGEVLPTDNHALFTRIILMMFNVTEEQRSDAEREEFKKLTRMEENGLTSITVELAKHRYLIENEFDTAYYACLADLNGCFGVNTIDGRMKKSAAWLMACTRILVEENKIDIGIEWKQYIKIWADNLKKQDQLITRNTEAAKFWDIMEINHRRMEISEEAGDFKIKDGFLILRINRIISPYTKEAYAQRLTKVLDKSSLKDYLENEPYFIPNYRENGRPKQERFSGSKYPVEAMWFDYAQLVEDFGIDLTRDITINGDEPEPVTDQDPDQDPDQEYASQPKTNDDVPY